MKSGGGPVVEFVVAAPDVELVVDVIASVDELAAEVITSVVELDGISPLLVVIDSELSLSACLNVGW